MAVLFFFARQGRSACFSLLYIGLFRIDEDAICLLQIMPDGLAGRSDKVYKEPSYKKSPGCIEAAKRKLLRQFMSRM